MAPADRPAGTIRSVVVLGTGTSRVTKLYNVPACLRDHLVDTSHTCMRHAVKRDARP